MPSTTATATTPDTPEPTLAPSGAACLDCGAPLGGRYCGDCGQRAVAGRLTLRGLWGEFAQQFLALDRGLWYTAAALARRPGAVIRGYIDGQRRRYVGPVTYLFFAAAVLLVATQLFADNDRAFMEQSARNLTTGRHPLLSPRQAEAYAALMGTLSQQMTTMTLAMAAPFALAVRWLFRRSGINLAEAGVFTLYTFAQAGVLYMLLVPILYMAGGSTWLRTAASLTVYAVVCTHAALGFFGRRVGSAVRTALALLVGYLSFSMLGGAAVLTYVLRTVPR